jgi:hypothetical protein
VDLGDEADREQGEHQADVAGVLRDVGVALPGALRSEVPGNVGEGPDGRAPDDQGDEQDPDPAGDEAAAWEQVDDGELTDLAEGAQHRHQRDRRRGLEGGRGIQHRGQHQGERHQHGDPVVGPAREDQHGDAREAEHGHGVEDGQIGGREAGGDAQMLEPGDGLRT